MPANDQVIYSGRYEPAEPAEPREQLCELDDVPGVAEATDHGFTALELVTGDIALAASWPAEHLRVVNDTRYAPSPIGDEYDPARPKALDTKIYLVRSPWLSLDLDTVLKLAYRWRRRNEDAFIQAGSKRSGGYCVDTEAQLAVDRQFFSQTEAWVRAYQRGRVNRLS